MSVFITKCFSSTADVECPTLKLDIVFILDLSASVGETSFRKCQDFIQNILSPLPIGPDHVRAAIIRMAMLSPVSYVSQTFYLKQHMMKKDKIKSISLFRLREGDTDTAMVINVVRTEILLPINGDREDVHDLVVLLTDGTYKRSERTLTAAKLLKVKSKLQILVIGVTDNIDEPTLRNISSGANLFLKMKSFSDLNQQLDVAIQILCTGLSTMANCDSVAYVQAHRLNGPRSWIPLLPNCNKTSMFVPAPHE
ncbi:hypothetical protein Btru_043780 [Bulinus truncatus]|nr:hypothetical protein Btru_043780 [Bulinus truncatus]